MMKIDRVENGMLPFAMERKNAAGSNEAGAFDDLLGFISTGKLPTGADDEQASVSIEEELQFDLEGMEEIPFSGPGDDESFKSKAMEVEAVDAGLSGQTGDAGDEDTDDKDAGNETASVERPVTPETGHLSAMLGGSEETPEAEMKASVAEDVASPVEDADPVDADEAAAILEDAAATDADGTEEAAELTSEPEETEKVDTRLTDLPQLDGEPAEAVQADVPEENTLNVEQAPEAQEVEAVPTAQAAQIDAGHILAAASRDTARSSGNLTGLASATTAMYENSKTAASGSLLNAKSADATARTSAFNGFSADEIQMRIDNFEAQGGSREKTYIRFINGLEEKLENFANRIANAADNKKAGAVQLGTPFMQEGAVLGAARGLTEAASLQSQQPVRMEQLSGVISERIMQIAKAGTTDNGTLTLRLYPRHLGDISVQLTHDNGGIRIEITTSTSAATQAFDNLKPDVLKSLQAVGVMVDDISVKLVEVRAATSATTADQFSQQAMNQDQLGFGNPQGNDNSGADSQAQGEEIATSDSNREGGGESVSEVSSTLTTEQTKTLYL